MTWVVVWEFETRPEKVAEFERTYGPDGDWARLFRKSDGYLGTELLRDRERAGTYVVLDRWASPEQYDSFKKSHAAEYAALDRRCEALTIRETPRGAFTALD